MGICIDCEKKSLNDKDSVMLDTNPTEIFEFHDLLTQDTIDADSIKKVLGSLHKDSWIRKHITIDGPILRKLKEHKRIE